MNHFQRQKFYSRFDAPRQANSFTRRVTTAQRWLNNAGMADQSRTILKDAQEFAGSSEDDFLAFVAWRICAFQAKGK